VPSPDVVLRSRLGSWRRPFAFLVAWAFLDALFNFRYPGDEPTLWFLLPSIDVVVLLAFVGVAGARGAAIPGGARLAILVLAMLVRIFRFAEGLVERHFHRPLSLYLDVPLVPNLVGLLRSTVSLPRLMGGVLVIIAGLVVIGLLAWHALRTVERSFSPSPSPLWAHRLFVAALVACALLSPLWPRRRDPHLHVGLYGASIVPRLAREVWFLRHAQDYRRDKAAAIARVQTELRATPHGLERLHHADVLLILVESYGETVLAEPAFASRMAPVYDAFERDLGGRGFAMASSLLASPTYGGRSWLAHGTLATGVRTEDGLAYTVLLAAQPPPLTMAGFFRDAGYRTVLVQPGTTKRWPEGEVIGFEKKYYAMDLEYRGPSFKWATMPDQYVIDFVHRREIAARPSEGRPPLFIEYALVSSHSPWSLQPRLVDDWDRLRDGGTIFDALPAVRYDVTWSTLERGGAAYVTSLIYDLEMLRRYVAERIAGDSLVIILGDHQPSAEVTGDDPSSGVPIHVISRDRSFIDRFLAAGYAPGMHAAAGARRSTPMELFLPQLLQMFSDPPAPAPTR
jgi:hypothetical protein